MDMHDQLTHSKSQVGTTTIDRYLYSATGITARVTNANEREG
jgi:hypothetical protein